MRTPLLFALSLLAALAESNTGRAQDGVDKAKAAAFDSRMFAGPLSQKTYACFVRRYDASHLAQHPRQKVSAMKLLVTAENAPADKTIDYSFRLGVQYRHRPGNFDSSGFAIMPSPKTPAAKSASAAASIAKAAALMSHCRKTTNPRSSGWSGSRSGIATSPTTRPAMPCWPAPTTRFFASTAPRRANVPSS